MGTARGKWYSILGRFVCAWRALPVMAGVAVVLSACGGGGGGGSGTSAPSGLSYPSPPAFVVNTAIATLTPTVTGTVTGYSVSPALPAGLGLDATTGTISGTPTAVTAQATYTVTASNSSGSTTAALSIVVEAPPPSALSYPSPPTFAVNAAIATLTPTVTGTVTGYSVSPALPAGLSLNTTTGAISGTPTAVTPQASYTVKATNASGSTTTTVSIVVVNPSGIAYRSSYYSFTVGVASQQIQPATVPLQASAWSVSPALPAGLSLNPNTGAISGTPTAAAAKATYVITANSSSGPAAGTVALQVVSSSLLDLGHAWTVILARLINSSLLTQDNTGHWVLWNYTSGQNLANGSAPVLLDKSDSPTLPGVDLQGSTVVIQTSSGLEVRSATTGTVLAEIGAQPSWWKLASDGSYVSAGNSTELVVWSSSGSVLFKRPGNYASAVVFAAPGQVQVALGAAGTGVIETITVPAGTSTVGPAFQGQFQSWFGDGGRFLTAVGTTAWVYSNASVQQDIASLSTVNGLAGQGNWYWTVGTNALRVFTLYAVGSAGTSTLTQALDISGSVAPVPSANLVGLLENPGTSLGPLIVLNLAGASPTQTSYTVPSNVPLSTFGAASSSAWVTGNQAGVLYDGASYAGQPRYLDYGAATSVAGGTNYAAVATSSGRVVYFDATTHAIAGTINSNAVNLSMSADGTVLAVGAGGDFSTDNTITVYSLPAGTTVATFPFSTTSGMASVVTNFTLSASGNALGERLLSTTSPCNAQVVAIPAGTTTWCNATTSAFTVGQLQLSPDGTLVGASPPSPFSPITVNPAYATTNIYHNGSLVTAVPVWINGWIDNSSLLGTTVTPVSSPAMYTSGTSIYSSSGQLNSTLPSAIPLLNQIQPLSSTSAYSPTTNAIYSLTTGTATWSSGSTPTFFVGSSAGGVSGADVVFESGNLILAEPY